MKGGEGEREEGMVEALGILSNLNIPELDFSKVVRDLQLLPFLTDRLRVLLFPIGTSMYIYMNMNSHNEYQNLSARLFM